MSNITITNNKQYSSFYKVKIHDAFIYNNQTFVKLQNYQDKDNAINIHDWIIVSFKSSHIIELCQLSINIQVAK